MLTAVRISNLKAYISSCYYRNTDDFNFHGIQLCGDGDGGGGGDDTVNCTQTAFEVLNFKNLYVRFGKN